jgi:hypothetical protein
VATITFKYDKCNNLASSIVNSIKSAGVFTVVKEEESPYEPQFVGINTRK